MLRKFETEREWLEARKENINSTDLAALFGLSQYKSRLRLWHEKAGNIEPDDLTDNPFARWGRRLQTVVGLGICNDEGWQGEDLAGFYLSCPDLKIGASMDVRAICPERGPGLLEVKTTGYFDEEMGWTKEKAPIDYEFQIMGQLHLAIKDKQEIGWGAIGALSGRKETRIFPRQPDAALGNLIDMESAKFWRSIELDEPPAPDYAVDSETLALLQGPVKVNKMVNLSGNNRAVYLVEAYQAEKIKLAACSIPMQEYEAKLKQIKAELHDLMGDSEIASVGDYRVSARTQEVEESIRYGYSFRRFDVKRIKGKNK